MKDYYYILGVSPNATEQEIKTAYKKLSILFHPDKNGGDKFFEDRFKEIQEAYQALSGSARRGDYDEQLKEFRNPNPNAQFNPAPPLVRQFDVSKKLVNEGDLVTITWNVANADSVHIAPIGLVETSGTKTIRLPNLVNKPFVKLTLTATNTFIQQSLEREIIIENRNFKNKPIQYLQEKTQQPEPSKKPQEQPRRYEPQPAEIRNQALAVIPKKEKAASSEPANNLKIALSSYLIMGIMLFLAVVMGYYVYQLNSLR